MDANFAMEGLEPVYGWLQQFDGSTDGFQAMQIPDWTYDLDQWRMAPVPDGIENSRLHLAPVSKEIEDHNRRQSMLHGNVDPNQLQLSAALNGADDRLQLLRETEHSPGVNNRVSDWLSKSQPEVVPLSDSRETTSVQDWSSELVALRSEISQYVIHSTSFGLC